MLIHFWGVRGSLPTPILNEQVQAKIAAAISRITPKDVETEEAKMKFLSTLPQWIYGTTGGNTACVEIKAANGTEILLDCGSGLRVFSQYGKQPENKEYHIFISHYHWDHIQGIPFFTQTYNPNSRIHIYSNFENAEEILKGQSSTPYFPENGCWKSVKNQFIFHHIKADESFDLNGIKVNSHKMKHPGDSYAFSFEETTENGTRKVIYSTDTELQPCDFDSTDIKNHFFKDADIIIMDSQYTNPELIQKENWGHSSFSNAIDFATLWNIKKLYLFHHEPNYDDKKLYSILQAGLMYRQYNNSTDVEVLTAQEGQEIEL